MTKSRMMFGTLTALLILSLAGNVTLVIINFWSMTHTHQVTLLQHDFDQYSGEYTIAHPKQ